MLQIPAKQLPENSYGFVQRTPMKSIYNNKLSALHCIGICKNKTSMDRELGLTN